MTQIKATLLTGGNHIETVSFPCSDDEIMRLTEQNEIGHEIEQPVSPVNGNSLQGTSSISFAGVRAIGRRARVCVAGNRYRAKSRRGLPHRGIADGGSRAKSRRR